MGGVAGAAGSIGSSLIQAQAQKDMLATKLENYWKQIVRLAKMDLENYKERRAEYGLEHERQKNDVMNTRARGDTGAWQNKYLTKKAYEEAKNVAKGPATDVYGNQRTYVPGQGFKVTMGHDAQQAFSDAMEAALRDTAFAGRVGQFAVPRAYGEYQGRKQYSEGELAAMYGQEARLADWRSDQVASKALGAQAMRGGNRSNFGEQIKDFLRQNRQDRQLRHLGARKQAMTDAPALNRANTDTAFANLSNLLGISDRAQGGQIFGQMANNLKDNLSGAEMALMSAISNIEPQTNANMERFKVWQSENPTQNLAWQIDKPGEKEARPNLSVS